MNTVTVSASRQYRILIGEGLLRTLGREAAQIAKTRNAVIVSDSNVWPLYGNIALENLENAGFSVNSFVFPAGESSKCGETYLKLLNFLAENRITRTDCLIALGGGVTGDLTGFAAATYLRGVPYLQVPTTLLAAVDSSVGGKTAIDLPAGKNLAGAFYQPSLVLCDTDTLSTLPEEIFRDGCAEVIKYGVLYDAALFDMLARDGLAFDRQSVITRCVELKRDVVAVDEFDTGARQKLNLGHTFGHGIEAASGYRVSHGQAVAAGMGIVARASVAAGFCSQDTCQAITDVLAKFGLPVNTPFSPQMLLDAALSDKKRSGKTLNLIVPVCIGNCSIQPVPTETLESFLKAGL